LEVRKSRIALYNYLFILFTLLKEKNTSLAIVVVVVVVIIIAFACVGGVKVHFTLVKPNN